MFTRILYNAVILPLMETGLLLGAIGSQKLRRGVLGRIGEGARLMQARNRCRDYKPRLIVHCASAGELESAIPLMDAIRLKADVDLILTIYSPSAVQRAKTVTSIVDRIYLPFDTAFRIRRMLDILQPDLIILVKHDVWPNLVWMASERGIPIVLVNGNFRPDSKRLNRLACFFNGDVLGSLTAIYAVAEDDASRFRNVAGISKGSVSLRACESLLRACESLLRACEPLLRACESLLRACDSSRTGTSQAGTSQAGTSQTGISQAGISQAGTPTLLSGRGRLRYHRYPYIEAAGDTRFDRVQQRALASRRDQGELAKILAERSVVVAGSTWREDESLILPAWKNILAQIPNAVLILVPHEPTPERLQQIQQECQRIQLKAVTLSAIERHAQLESIIIVDRSGILAGLYGLGKIGYVGGGFGKGVHSVIEPAVFGIGVLFGPRHFNSHEARDLLQLGAAVSINSSQQLETLFLEALTEGEASQHRGKAAGDFVQRQAGVAEILAERLIKLIASRS